MNGAPTVCIMNNTVRNGVTGIAQTVLGTGAVGYGSSTGQTTGGGNGTTPGAGGAGGANSGEQYGGNGADGLVTIKWIYSY